MDINVVIGAFLGLMGAVCINIGKGVEKMKVHVFAQGWGMFRAPHRRDLGIWLLGLCMTASYGVFQWGAMRFVNNPSLVVSMSGLGLVALVLFAVRVIGERTTKKEIIGIAVIVLATIAMPYFQAPKQIQTTYNLKNLFMGTGIPLVVFGLLSLYALYSRRIHGFSFGALAGACNAVPSLLIKVSWVHVGENAPVWGQLREPFLYVAVLIGIGATIFTQLGFWRDRAIIVVPSFMSFNIVIPAVLEYYVFGVVLQPAQFVALAAIIAGVIFLSAATPEKVLAVEPEKTR